MAGAWGLSWGRAWGLSWGGRRMEMEFSTRKSKRYVRIGKKIHLFNSDADADDWLDANRRAEDAARSAKRSSRRARKRVCDRVIRDCGIVPEQTLDTSLLAGLIKSYSMSVNLDDLIIREAWEKVFLIHQMAMQLQEEEDIELLLVAQ